MGEDDDPDLPPAVKPHVVPANGRWLSLYQRLDAEQLQLLIDALTLDRDRARLGTDVGNYCDRRIAELEDVQARRTPSTN